MGRLRIPDFQGRDGAPGTNPDELSGLGIRPLNLEGGARVLTLNLATANTDTRVRTGPGVSLWVIAATDGSSNATVKYDRSWLSGYALRQGTFFTGIPFTDLWVSNAAQAGHTLTLLVTPAPIDVRDHATAGSRSASVASGSVSIAAAATTIVPVNLARRRIHIRCDPFNATGVTISPTGAGTQYELLPGDSITLETTAQIRAIRSSPYGALGGIDTPQVVYFEELD